MGLGRLHQELIVEIWRRRRKSWEAWAQDVQEERWWTRPVAGECWHFQAKGNGVGVRDGEKKRGSEESAMPFKTLWDMVGLWLSLWIRWGIVRRSWAGGHDPTQVQQDPRGFCVKTTYVCLGHGDWEGIWVPSEHVFLPCSTFCWF